LLWLAGEDLRDLPLVERKRRLRRIIPRRSAFVLYLDHVDGGRDLFAEVCRRDLEGIVAKWKRGAYRAAPLSSWVKIKNPTYSQAEGRHELFERDARGPFSLR